SLDNLSLMALTIAVGFVVDDAIVVVENIHRHIEDGASPFEAALQGSREIGVTVLSISLSLVAVFIPLLLMGGIIGRMFREFALTVTASIAVSALVSLTLAPMLCSRFMHREPEHHGRVYRVIEAGFNALLSAYKRTLDVVLRHQAITLGVFFATMALTVVMTLQIPKGFFPIHDTGVIQGFAETAQDAPPEQMMRILREFGTVLLRDPDVAGFGSFTGSTGGANTANTGRFFIVLKPRDERELTSSQIIDRLRPQLAKVQGATLFLQPTQDLTIGGRTARACSPTRPSPLSSRSPAPPAAPTPPIRGVSSSCSSHATSASSPPRKSSTGCGRSSPKFKARRCSCSRPRTSPWAAALPAPVFSTRCRTPTSPNSTNGRISCSRRCARCRSSPTRRATSWRTPRSSRSPSIAIRPRASASRRR